MQLHGVIWRIQWYMEVMHLYSLWQNMAFIPSMLAIIFMILTMNSSGGQSRAFAGG